MDYRTMTAGDWALPVIILLLCALIVYTLVYRPMTPWRSTQRWRAPGQSEEDLGEPTPAFCRICKVVALVVAVVGILSILSPFMPRLLGH